jgi:DNA polymerase III delta subunit
MIFVILGPDRLRARNAVNNLVKTHDPDGQNTYRFDAAADPLSSVINGVATPSFFGEARVIIATGYLARSKPGISASESTTGVSHSSRGNSNSSELKSLLSISEENAILILHEPDLAAVPTGVKSLLPGSAKVADHQPQRGQALVDLTIASFEKRNTSIDREAARYLLDRLFLTSWQQSASNPAFEQPPDTETLINEIEKLSLASGSEEISQELIDELTPQAATERTFPMVDAVVGGQKTTALRELSASPHTEDDQIRILAQLMQQIEYAAAAAQPGRPSDPQQAGRALGMSNPNRMRHVLRAASDSRVPPAQLLDIALEADRRIKRGLDPEPVDALYSLILGSPERRAG